jgi:hypothetical protein
MMVMMMMLTSCSCRLPQREKDPFTINDFLTQHINKIRYDRFEGAVELAFRGVKSTSDK